METPPLSHFIFVVCFFSFFSVIVATLPVELLTDDLDFRGITVPSYFESSSIENLASTYVINLPSGTPLFSDDWGIDEGFTHNFLFSVDDDGTDLEAIYNEHYFPFLGFPTGFHTMEWINYNTGEEYGTVTGAVTSIYGLTIDEIEAGVVNSSGTSSMRCLLKCEHVSMHVWVGFNSTLYSTANEAWQNDGLSVEFAITWDELGTGLNAWNLITAILFYQAPDIHWAINSFIAIPLWASIAWMTFAFGMAVIKSLPFT